MRLLTTINSILLLATIVAPSAAHADDTPEQELVITVESNVSGTEVANQVGSGQARSSQGVAASAQYLESLCSTPCTLSVSPGFYTFSAVAPGYVTANARIGISEDTKLLATLQPTWKGYVAYTVLTAGLLLIINGAVDMTLVSYSYGKDPSTEHAIPARASIGLGVVGAVVSIPLRGASRSKLVKKN